MCSLPFFLKKILRQILNFFSNVSQVCRIPYLGGVVSARRHGQWPVSYEGGREEEEEEELCPSFVESEVLMSRVRKGHLGGEEGLNKVSQQPLKRRREKGIPFYIRESRTNYLD